MHPARLLRWFSLLRPPTCAFTQPPWTLAEEASLAKWHSILGNR